MAKSIGKFIQSLRKANGYTQESLAEVLGVSNKTISSWETDNSAPDLTMIPVLADLFHVTCDEILRGEKLVQTEDSIMDSKKSEAVKKNLMNKAMMKYSNSVYISIAIFFVFLIMLIFGIIFLNQVFGLVLFIISLITYIGGAVFSLINYNNSKYKAEEKKYQAFIYKRRNLLISIYGFLIPGPFLAVHYEKYLMNLNENKEEDTTIYKKNNKLRKTLAIILGACILFIIVVRLLSLTYIFQPKYSLSDIKEEYTTYEVTTTVGEDGYADKLYIKSVSSPYQYSDVINLVGMHITPIQGGTYNLYGVIESGKNSMFDTIKNGNSLHVYYKNALIMVFVEHTTTKGSKYYAPTPAYNGPETSDQLVEFAFGMVSYKEDSIGSWAPNYYASTLFTTFVVLQVVYLKKKEKIVIE